MLGGWRVTWRCSLGLDFRNVVPERPHHPLEFAYVRAGFAPKSEHEPADSELQQTQRHTDADYGDNHFRHS